MRFLQFASLVRFSVEHPVLVLVLALTITAISMILIPGIKIESDVETLLPSLQDQPDRTTSYDRVAVKFEGKGLFTIEGLNIYHDISMNIGEKLKAKSVRTVFNFITLESWKGRLRAITMSPGARAPQTEVELADFQNRLDNNPFTRGYISSKDGKDLTSYFLIPKSSGYIQKERFIRDILSSFDEKLRLNNISVLHVGSIHFSAEIEKYITQDSLRLLFLVILTILLGYYIGFRSRRAMLIPVAIVSIAILWSLGFTITMGWKISIVSIVSPPLILTLGSAYSIHILSEYYRLPDEDKKSKIIRSVTGVSGTITMAAITTILAMLCLLIATMKQTREFAIITSIGVAFTAILSVTVFPALLYLQKPVNPSRIRKVNSGILVLWLQKFSSGATTRLRSVLSLLIFLAIALMVLLPRISFNTNPASYFPDDSQAIQNIHSFTNAIGGWDEITIKLYAPDKKMANYFLEDETLTVLHKVEKQLLEEPRISHLLSLPSYLNFASSIASGNNKPRSRALNMLVGRMLAAAGRDPSTLLTNKDFTEIYTRVRVFNNKEYRPVDEKDTRELSILIDKILSSVLPEDITWSVSGAPIDFLNLSESIQRDFQYSTLLAVAVILIFCSLSFRSLVWGIMTLIPFLTGITSTFLLMALFSIPLDMTTIMINCIAIGVGIDDAIHFMLRYRKERSHCNPEFAAIATINNSGRPIILTTLSIVLGLMWFSLADFRPVFYFGMLIVFTLSTTCFATLFILPPILMRVSKN